MLRTLATESAFWAIKNATDKPRQGDAVRSIHATLANGILPVTGRTARRRSHFCPNPSLGTEGRRPVGDMKGRGRESAVQTAPVRGGVASHDEKDALHQPDRALRHGPIGSSPAGAGQRRVGRTPSSAPWRGNPRGCRRGSAGRSPGEAPPAPAHAVALSPRASHRNRNAGVQPPLRAGRPAPARSAAFLRPDTGCWRTLRRPDGLTFN